jgi:peptidoglycan hydrolase-like protein with peptidoglycan-binding domain
LSFDRELQKGIRGPDDPLPQRRLRELNLFSCPENTGYHGDITLGAVAHFQERQGLPVTRIADQATISALNRCVNDCVQ